MYNINCFFCNKIIGNTFDEPRLKETDYCNSCEKISLLSDKFLEENRELLEDMIKGGD